MAEPLTTAEAKAHLRKTDTSEDALIAGYIIAAREWIEKYTGHILVQREVEEPFSAWGDYLTLRHQPITVGDPTPTLTVFYTDSLGAEIEYEGRVVRDQRYPWTILPANGGAFPSLGPNGTVTVSYTAGYTNPAAVPQALKHAMMLLIAHWFSVRSGVGSDAAQELPLGVKSLCLPYRGVVAA